MPKTLLAGVLPMLAAIATYAQVPDSIARIETISPQDTLVVKNTGSKALTGVVIVNIIPGENKGEVVWADRSYTPVNPGNVENTIRLWDEVDTHAKLTDQIKMGAVIFADGTHLGRAINPDYYNKEAVAQIFELRAGLAAGWNQWAAKINAMSAADDNTVVQQFLEAVDAMPEPSMEATTTDLTPACAMCRSPLKRWQTKFAVCVSPREQPPMFRPEANGWE